MKSYNCIEQYNLAHGSQQSELRNEISVFRWVAANFQDSMELYQN